MNAVLIGLVAGALAAVSLSAFSIRIGYKLAENDRMEAELVRADKFIIKQKEVIREVPKIVVRVVEKTVTVEKEVERVITIAPTILAADCVLPDHYGMLLVAAANGVDPASTEGIAFRGNYGCVEVLAATLKDLSAGWKNSARLTGLQAWAQLVTHEDR